MRTILFGLFSIGFLPAFLWAACADSVEWNNVLQAHVNDAGLVDYNAIQETEKETLDKILKTWAVSDIRMCSVADQTAFWINAYNAHMIAMVLARPTLRLISDDFKLFDEKFPVAGLNVSLNDIENRILRGDPKKGGPLPGVSINTREPRIHFALVCGAVDCPRLINRAYRGEDLDAVLQSNAIAFANNSKYLAYEKGRVHLSSLMKWYQDDFKVYGGVVPFLVNLTDSKLRSDADQIDQKLKTDFPQNVTFKYDWALNSLSNQKENNPMIAVGSPAPDFKLKDDSGRDVSLKDFRGKTIVLYFYPKDDTPGCTKEACDFRDNKKRYQKKNTIVLGVSADSVESHLKFKKKFDLPFPLLSDPDKKVIQAYGVWKEKSMYGKKYMGIERTTFVIDPDGKIAKIYPKVSVTDHVEEVLGGIE